MNKIGFFIRTAKLLALVTVATPAHAFLFFFPLPNLSKPAQLNSLIDALEKSEETKAVAYVSEDKVFGQKMWVWGHAAGHFPQAEADRVALQRCFGSLTQAKLQFAGGKPLYDFGLKGCELYSFANKTVSSRAHEWNQPPPAALPAPVPVPTAAGAAQAATPPPAQPTEAASAPTGNSPADATPAATAPAVDAPSLPATLPSPVSAVSSPGPAKAATATPSVVPTAKPPNTESPTARRLRELELLRQEGLITEREFQEKRKAILSSL